MNPRTFLRKIWRRLRPGPPAAPAPIDEWRECSQRCVAAPTSSTPHLALARLFLQRQEALRAHACYRTARAWGAAPDAVLEADLATAGLVVGQAPAAGSPAFAMLEFQRLSRIAQRVQHHLGSRRGTVLDVGGGDGALALFLPQHDYVLVEPLVNGLTIDRYAAVGQHFDLVTCCHVLEHIPPGQKESFLAALVGLARERVILLGPSIDQLAPPPIDALVYRITQQAWAAEHLECELPRVAQLKEFARQQGLTCEALPNGDIAATYWMIFALHYAGLAGRRHEMKEIMEMYNRKISPDPAIASAPNDYLIEFGRPSTATR